MMKCTVGGDLVNNRRETDFWGRNEDANDNALENKRDDHLRHAAFAVIRQDKKAHDVVHG